MSASQALDMLRETRAAGVMIGRGAMRNPWIFSQIIELAEGRPVPQLSPRKRAELVERHIRLMREYFDEPTQTLHMLKKYLCAYSSGMPGATSFRERVNRSHDLERTLEDANQFFKAAA